MEGSGGRWRNVGGIRRQIKDGENGFPVNTVDETAHRIVQLVKDAGLRQKLGAKAKSTVRDNFLLTRLIAFAGDCLRSLEQCAGTTTRYCLLDRRRERGL